MAYDVGGRGDFSFNDSAGRGLDKAKTDFGIQTKELQATPTDSDADRASRLDQLAQNGYNPIIAIGFAYSAALKTEAAKYPNIKFAIVDDASNTAANITNLVFTEEQSSYLVGVAAALKSKTNTVGFIGGVDVPLIHKFQAGFQAGVASVKPSDKVLVKYLTPAGNFAGFSSPNLGKAAAQGMLSQGADVIYSAAGSSGNGAIEAVHAQPGAWAIGVDSDQYNLPGLAQYKQHPDLRAEERGRRRLRLHPVGQVRYAAHRHAGLQPRQERRGLLHLRWVRRRHQGPAGQGHRGHHLQEGRCPHHREVTFR
jgi:basic membrane protein A